ncbi:MAG: hypothetical protein R6U39_08685 [Candidatus Aegiribacteria sp.]
MAEWRPAASSIREYAECAGKPDYVRGLAANPPGGGVNPNLLSFTNSGGLLGKGVCWWHSRFTRAALYLAFFLPDRPRPGRARARDIISSLMKADRIVAIPGYECLREFSAEYERDIRRTLERRQLLEGLVFLAWINGLAGASDTGPCRMKTLMDRIYAECSARGLVYVKFQTPGIDAHSLIITGCRPDRYGGYAVRYLDSNRLREEVLRYRTGFGSLELASGMTGVPYVQRSGELRRFLKLTDRFAPEAF